ncbi:MAG: TetR/AcrR family transcriptional regulator C-terminal domain-containing protein [Rhodothalassiaceae bacterium]
MGKIVANSAPAVRARPRSADKRKAIIDAAGELFLTRGFSGTSMDEVARAASVSKQTVYSHFHNKERLYAACIRRVCNDYFPDAVSIAPDADIATRLSLIGTHFVRLIVSEPAVNMFRTLVAQAAEGPEMAELFYETGPAALKREIEAVLACAIARGELKPCDTDKACGHFAALLKGEMHFRLSLGLPMAVSESDIDAHVADCVAVFLAAYASGSTASDGSISGNRE